MNNVFGVNDNGLFDPVAHSQGGCQHLMQHLWDAYCEYLSDQLKARTDKGLAATTIDDAKKKSPATHFVKWAAEYLKANRVVQSFFIDENHGVQLANNTMVAICPGVEVRGTMQDSGAVQVTEGRSQRNNNGVVNPDGDVMRI